MSFITNGSTDEFGFDIQEELSMTIKFQVIFNPKGREKYQVGSNYATLEAARAQAKAENMALEANENSQAGYHSTREVRVRDASEGPDMVREY